MSKNIYNKEAFKAHSSLAPGAEGKGNSILIEPIPDYPGRKGDAVVTAANFDGVNNNAAIIFGRDRFVFGPKRSRTAPYGSDENPNTADGVGTSGYSDYMGAGAIDIVVGRGAPFPLLKTDADGWPTKLAPHYTTRNPASLGTEKILRKREGTGEIEKKDHPGYVMDAARIYISQMCQVDKYFEIKSEQSNIDNGPCSAIMLKADKLRMHSRRDVYIVAGGDRDANGEVYDSNGYKIKDSGKIYLMSQNGLSSKAGGPRPPTGVVRFSEMNLCIRAMTQCMQEIVSLIHTLAKNQSVVNNTVANSIYGTPVGMTTCDPFAQASNQIHLMGQMQEDLKIHALKMNNIPNIETNFLSRGLRNYIGSRNVFVN